MKSQTLAFMAAQARGISGTFEKNGMHLGGLLPQMMISICTSVALIILGAKPLTKKTVLGTLMTNEGIDVLTI